MPTSEDPLNCGKCGNACTGATACSAGQCATACLPGLTLCSNDHTCVDKANDNAHCGSCTNKCAAGKGCVGGTCVDSIPLGGPPGKCTGGGGPIVNAPDQGGCLGALAATTFRWTLCSCKDVQLSALILVDAYDSTKGPYQPGGVGGGVGADREYHSSSASVAPTGGIYGDLWASSSVGIDDSADELVKHEVRCGGPLHSSAHMTIGADAYVDGGVSGGVSIGGKLHVPKGATVSVTPAGGIVREAVSFPPPCDCGAKQLVPVPSMVTSHATKNDNALIGLDEHVLGSVSNAPARLDLPCGSYYLSDIHNSKAVTIWAHGQTALYVGGDVSPSDALAFGVDANGAFDIFVGGKLDASAKITVGSPNHPALTRTYVGSVDGVSFSSDANLAGNLYAAYGPVTWSAGTDAFGSVFAGDFNASAATRIHYDSAVLRAGDTCPMAGGTTGGDAGAGDAGGTGDAASGSDGGMTSGGCTSCRDCLNQACVQGACGRCTTDSDCCSPLVCQAGTCVTAGVLR
jgi:hypothetical protein